MKIEEILSASSKLPFHIYFLWILWFSVGAFLLYYTLRAPTPANVTAPEPPRPQPPRPQPPAKAPSGGGSAPLPRPGWSPVPGSKVGGSPGWEGSRRTAPDKQGKSADFEIYICSQEFSWKYGSSEVTELND